MITVDELEALKIPHYYNDEDCWYSCPKSTEGCCDDKQKDCNCGADKHNEKVDVLINKLKDKS